MAVLLCITGQLCADANKKRLVSSDAWNLLLKYFPNATSFTKKMPPCPNCLVSVLRYTTVFTNNAQASLNHAVEEHQLAKDCAIHQKEELTELYLNKNRPQLDKVHCVLYSNS